jgi:phospholipase C
MNKATIGMALCGSLLAACAADAPTTDEETTQQASTHAARHFQHIFYIMMENHGTDEIIGNTSAAPFINSLASRYGVAMSYFGVTHPSLPNYLSAISGSFQGIWDDCKAGADITCAPEEFVPDSGDATDTLLLTPAQIASASATPHMFDGPNIVDRLEDRGLTWKAYMQAIPEVGSTVEYWPYDSVTGAPRKLYAQKHNPFMYFSDVRSDARRMQQIVPYDQLQADLDANTVPSFVWVSPDQCHDMHGVSAANAAALGMPLCAGSDNDVIGLGDAFLANAVSAITHSRAWQQDSAIVIAWDEDDYAGYDGCCNSPTTTGGAVLGGARAPALVITSKAPAHKVTFAPANHYSMLKAIERLWNLDCLGETCHMSGNAMLDLFMP